MRRKMGLLEQLIEDKNMNSKLDKSFQVDKFGRIVIEDEKLLEQISGAIKSNNFDTTNVGCGANNLCPNWTCNEIPHK